MSTLDAAKHQAIEALRAALPEGASASVADLVRPPQAEMGDLSFACFGAAKAAKAASIGAKAEGNPAAIAKEVAAKIAPSGMIAEAKPVGPYVNFFLNKKAVASAVLKEVSERGAKYGSAEESHGKKILLEYASPNTHKELHVGHLMNFSFGLSVQRLLVATGSAVHAVNYIGDVGAHVAKWLWYFKKEYSSADDLSSLPFGKIYTEATRAADASGNEVEAQKNKEEIGSILRALEAHDPEWEKLWLETRDECLRQIAGAFKELGSDFSRTYLESQVEERGKEIVNELREQGIAKEGEKGAIIVDLADQDLGVFLVLKSDGSSLYSTKELALAERKFSDYPDIEESIHVVDNRQSLYFKQLFATLKKRGFDKPMMHLAHDFVTLADGAMSSRQGNIITYEDFRTQMVDRIIRETEARHTDWNKSQRDATTWMIAEGAMKFGMLRQDANRPIVFDMQEALSFEGFTGPYIQYAHARLCSILAKAGAENSTAGQNAEGSDDEKEYALLRVVADMPDQVRAAASAYKPSVLAQYLFDLAQAASAFYRDVPVLTAEPADRARRLAIAEAARTAIENGLYLLGIRAPREM